MPFHFVVMGSAVYAVRRGTTEHDEVAARRFIVWGGVVFPTVVITVLLVFGLRTLPDLLALGPEDASAVEVSAEQWWWRVSYEHRGHTVAAGNELDERQFNACRVLCAFAERGVDVGGQVAEDGTDVGEQRGDRQRDGGAEEDTGDEEVAAVE